MQLLLYVCILLNIAFVCGNVYFAHRTFAVWREQKKLTDAMQYAMEDFTRRVLSGHLIAETTDGRIGTVKVAPHGPDGLKLSIVNERLQ